MTAVTEVLDRTIKRFRVVDSPDVLVNAIGAADLTLTYQGFLPNWGPGTVAEIDSELMMVTEVDSTNKVATVVRGWLGTAAAAHSSGVAIFLNPRLMRDEVVDLFNDCLTQLYPTLWKPTATELTYVSTTSTYNLPADAGVLVSVHVERAQRQTLWEPVKDFYPVAGLDTGEFAGGRGIVIRATYPRNSKVRVVYGSPFTAITSEANDLTTDVGLRSYMENLLYYFALSRILPAWEANRTQMDRAQAHQRSQDNPAFAALRTGDWYNVRYNELLRNCAQALEREYPRTMRGGYGS